MAITILENGWVSDSFTIGESPSFTDAIVMPLDDYNVLTADEIAVMKQQRYDQWIAILNSSTEVIDG